MAKAKFRIPFQNNSFVYPNSEGEDQIISFGRASESYTQDGQLVNDVIIKASQAVIDELKVNPDYTWIEDIVDN